VERSYNSLRDTKKQGCTVQDSLIIAHGDACHPKSELEYGNYEVFPSMASVYAIRQICGETMETVSYVPVGECCSENTCWLTCKHAQSLLY